MKVLKIEWIDSCASNMAWLPLAEIDGEIEPIKIVSYGVFVQETDDTITIAQNYGIEPEQVGSLMTIPKGCIKRQTEIEDFKFE